MFNNLIPQQEIEELIGKPVDTSRPYTPQDLVYILNQHPFIQIVNPDAKFAGEIKHKITKLASGWNLFDYGDALCSSAGEFMFGGADYLDFIQKILSDKKTDEDDGRTTVNPGKGTIIKQTYDTIKEIIDIAISKGWGGIELVDGTPLMTEFLWRLCEESGLTLDGYTPDEEEEANAKRKRRIKELITQAPILQAAQPD